MSCPDIDLLPKLAIFFGTSPDRLPDFDQSPVNAVWKRGPAYRETAEIMEEHWKNGTIAGICR